MSKSKPLSRNKTIKILHESTGKTYKECRATLKANNWSLDDALDINALIAALQFLPEAYQGLQRTISDFALATIEALNAFYNRLSEALTND